MRRDNKRGRGGKRSLLLSAVALLLLTFFPTVQEEIFGKDILGELAREAFGQGEKVGLEVHYLDVGQGDATLILQGDHAMLIDAGENDKGTQVQSYLKAQGVDSLDYVVGTHPDSDHIGGLDVILYKFDCGKVIMPDYAKSTKTYEDVITTMERKNYKNTLPVVGEVYELGDAVFTIVAPNGTYGDNANDYSVGILLQYGNTRFLFTGDAEEASEADMLKNGMDLSADVYKVSHHGSRTASTEEFLKAVDPRYAVISCGEDNSYGHPHAAVMNRLRSMGVQVFRTDLQGTVTAYSDGEELTFNMSPEESWKAGEPKGNSREKGRF